MEVKLLTLKELSKEMNVDIKTLRKHFIYQPDFPYIKFGNTKRYRLEDVSFWLDRNTKFV